MLPPLLPATFSPLIKHARKTCVNRGRSASNVQRYVGMPNNLLVDSTSFYIYFSVSLFCPFLMPKILYTHIYLTFD